MWLRKLSPPWNLAFYGLLMSVVAGASIVSAYNSYQYTVHDGLTGLRDRGDAFTRTLEACMQAEYARGTLSAEWLHEVTEDLIVAWDEPRALVIEERNGETVARAGDLSLLEGVTDGRATIGDDELFVHSADVQLLKPANEQSNSASSVGDAEGAFRIRVVLNASDAYFAGEFAWNTVIEIAIPWIGFVVMAMAATFYSERLRAQKHAPAITLNRSNF